MRETAGGDGASESDLSTEGLDPEEVALQWALQTDKTAYTRLNYWLVTEGLLLAAFAAASANSLGELSWSVRFALSLSGVAFTIIWHSLYIRNWSWFDWYYTRLQAIHWHRHGKPKEKDELPPWGVFPSKGHMRWRKWQGISTKTASHVLMFMFILVWTVFTVLSLVGLGLIQLPPICSANC